MKGTFNLPKPVPTIDGSMREGLQSEEIFVPTETKMFLLERLIDAGFQCMEADTFSPPEAMSQFRDTEELFKRLPRRPNVLYINPNHQICKSRPSLIYKNLKWRYKNGCEEKGELRHVVVRGGLWRERTD